MMAQHGFAGTTFAMIATSVGRTKQTVQAHFTSKECLGCDVLALHWGVFDTRLREIEGEHRKAEARLRAYVWLELGRPTNAVPSITTRLCAEFESLPDAMKNQLYLVVEGTLGWLRAIVEGGQATGELNASLDPWREAESLHAIVTGGALAGLALSRVDPSDGPQHAGRMAENVIRRMRAGVS